MLGPLDTHRAGRQLPVRTNHAHYRTACGLQEDGTALCFTANSLTTLPEELSMVKAPGTA